MGVSIIKPRQKYVQSNAEPEAKPVVVGVWTGGGARRQKERLGRRAVGSTSIRRPSAYREGGSMSRYQDEQKVWPFEQPHAYRKRGGGNRAKRKESQKPSHEAQKGTKLDLDAISDCLRTLLIIE
jgi:hypothetical protein